MIASSPYAGGPERYRRLLWLIAAALVAATLTIPAFVHAASLRVCILDDAPPESTTAPVFLNASAFAADMLAGSSVADGKRCNALPIPPTLAKGQTFTVTVKYVTPAGTSVPSNAISFRNPGQVPVIDSVQVVAP